MRWIEFCLFVENMNFSNEALVEIDCPSSQLTYSRSFKCPIIVIGISSHVLSPSKFSWAS